MAPKLAFVALDVLFPFPQRHLDRLASPTAAPRVLDRAGNVLQAFVAADDSWSFPVPLSEMSPHLAEATIAVEDGRFRSHRGVDALAVARAAWSNLARLRTVSGASTITMQTVRLLEPRRRTLAAKLIEAFRALQLEELRAKDEILAGYLNLAPYGGNFTGAEAASLAYFGKHARDLTLAEAALLAGLPQAPSRLRPDRFPDRARARREAVLRRMLSRGAIRSEAFELANREPSVAQRVPFPCAAPHWVQLVRQRFPGRATLHTTLDPQTQHVAATALREAVAAVDGAGISNGAAVVLENETGAVRALVGSCDFLAEQDGQVNGATAPRSPGSALKPFTYALAFERGLCTPDAILADVPASYTGYEPENYDHTCRGPVPAREALAASLNIPAVRLAREVGHQSLFSFLKQLGFTTLTRDADHYGLALTLGSVEVTLLDLTSAYAALARLGVCREPRLLETEPVSEGRRVLSDGAAWLVLEALSDARRLGLGPRWEPAEGLPRLAWKTGTSHGHRDAWTVACTPRHTVGVWLGNFSGRPARELVGVQAAAPVAARILDWIEAGRPSQPFARPECVQLAALCAVSGMRAGPHCPAATQGLTLRTSGVAGVCSVHVPVKVDATTGVRLCPRCAGNHASAARVAECWPPELAAWLRHHGRGGNLPPPHNPACASVASADTPPRVLSPVPGQTYVLLADAPHQRLTLRAASRAGTLYWFVNGVLVAAGAPLEPAFWPLRPGTHTITCADDAGLGTSLTIAVR
ncbi:MAG TPA: penicillin-binding protein 1C [Planctomycetota bacterium]|nr:penicillin-binding protein 1C [Planctomycetota bacterium]HRR78759.1 penicillin-binding protein 1C [Planctomycetota bacterium]HRT95228.1 penicillin-binding protein 1C [Planctomycetota bacterium]